jgi:DnaJ-class molecular chaperone
MMSGPAVVVCRLCEGTGSAADPEANPDIVCGTCSGLGSVVVYLSPEGKPVACARCDGKGKMDPDQACPSCLGCGWSGRMRESR